MMAGHLLLLNGEKAWLGKVDCIAIEGLRFWFNSNDHLPPHFHVTKTANGKSDYTSCAASIATSTSTESGVRDRHETF